VGGEVKANPILYRIEVKRVSSTSVPDPRGPRSEIPLSDALMAGLGVFGLKYPSLLKFDEASREGVMRYNLNTLYGVERAPCDTRSTTTIPQILPYAGISVLSHRGNGNTTVRDFDFAILAVWFLLLVALAGSPGEKPPSYPLNQRRNGKALSSLTARGGGLPVEVIDL
jgi:hypothetical protein